MSFKMLNTIASIFYARRGLTLQEIFLLGVVFAVINLILEIPSSYAADLWGRKKTIIVAVTLLTVSSIFDFYAHSFVAFAVGIAVYAASYAMMSGTDEALIYDTSRELGDDKNSLKELGKYYSAQRFFKIATPLLAVFIAQSLLEWQFKIIIGIEFLTTLSAFIFVTRITEPQHQMDIGKIESGIIVDAWKLIRTDWKLIKIILSRTIIFIAIFLVWRIHQEYFINHGLSILGLGIMWVIINTTGYFCAQNISRIAPRMSDAHKIDILNTICSLSAIGFAAASFLGNIWLLVVMFCIACEAEVMRWPLYSNIFNQRSKSFNRATTLSLTNLIKSVIDIPLTLTAIVLVAFNPSYVYIFVAVVVCSVMLLVPVRKQVSI